MNYENKGYLFFSSIHSLFMIRYLIKKMLTFQNFWDHWSLKTEAIALDEIENCYAIIIIINNNYYYNHNLIAIIIIETWCTVATVFQKYNGQKCTRLSCDFNYLFMWQQRWSFFPMQQPRPDAGVHVLHLFLNLLQLHAYIHQWKLYCYFL